MPVAEVVVVDVVLVVPVALVSVVLVVPVIAVPDVSVPVAGVELEPVVLTVSVTAVPVVSLLVLLMFSSFLQATAKVASARTHRTARVFFIVFLSKSCTSASPGRRKPLSAEEQQGCHEKQNALRRSAGRRKLPIGRAYFLPFFSVFFSVLVVELVSVAGAVEDIALPVVPVVLVIAVSVVDIVPLVVVMLVLLIDVSVVDIVPVVPVAAVSVAEVTVVDDVSDVAVSVLTFSSFLQPTAKIATAKRAIRVITRDFFIC